MRRMEPRQRQPLRRRRDLRGLPQARDGSGAGGHRAGQGSPEFTSRPSYTTLSGPSEPRGNPSGKRCALTSTSGPLTRRRHSSR